MVLLALFFPCAAWYRGAWDKPVLIVKFHVFQAGNKPLQGLPFVTFTPSHRNELSGAWLLQLKYSEAAISQLLLYPMQGQMTYAESPALSLYFLFNILDDDAAMAFQKTG